MHCVHKILNRVNTVCYAGGGTMDIYNRLKKLSGIVVKSTLVDRMDAVNTAYLHLLEDQNTEREHTNSFLKTILRQATQEIFEQNSGDIATTDIDDETVLPAAEAALAADYELNRRYNGATGIDSISDERLLKIYENPHVPSHLKKAMEIILEGCGVEDAAEEVGCTQRELTWGLKSLADFTKQEIRLFDIPKIWEPGKRFRQTQRKRPTKTVIYEQASLF